MNTIYVLTKDLPDWGQREMICWSCDKTEMEAEALRREWADHEAAVEANGRSQIKIMSPDETDYRRYTVEPLERL